ncbi:RHS repeat-associated core domain-containing protein, partial [Streptomyces sp. NRRL F-2664]|uniref:RHS repeat-associated core domain-containing protein n=1 Tax=Streptomyces sp. NRRL F-2664 TaxID=1463842 RepID=UPI0018FE3939
PARLYHPETGRFTTRDPHPTPLNKYQAFAANPIEHTDPTGNIQIRLKQRSHLGDVEKYTPDHVPGMRSGEGARSGREEKVIALPLDHKAPEPAAMQRNAGVDAIRTLYSSVVGMSQREVSKLFLASIGPDGSPKSVGRNYFNVAARSVPPLGCQALFAACLKFFGEGELVKPHHRVEFNINNVPWPIAAKGGMGKIVSFMNSGNMVKGRLYGLAMNLVEKGSGRMDGHIVLAFLGSHRGEPVVKQAEYNAYGFFDPTHWDDFWQRFQAVYFGLFDTGLNKLSSGVLFRVAGDFLKRK